MTSFHTRRTPSPRLRPASRLFAALTATAVLSGCASFSADGGFGRVEQTAGQRLGKQLAWPKTAAEQDLVAQRVAELLARPLSADDAVQIALLNNQGLQASFHELGISEAELVQAGRLANPGFSFSRLKRGSEVELERSFSFDLLGLLTMPLASRIARQQFELTQASVAMEVLSLAARTRTAYLQALAAEQSLRYKQQVQDTAEASAELARRMAQVGNFNKLQQMREQGFYADAALNLARASQARVAGREKLVRLLGLWGAQTQFALPDRLPDLPKEAQDQPDIERLAMAQRLDVQAAKRSAEQTAAQLGLTRATRFVNVLELGVARNSSNEAPTQRGVEISVELPLFDGGGARSARAEAVYRQALNRAAETAIDARSEVREAYAAYRAAYDIARHQRDEVVPLRQRIAEENVLRYNGMLIGVFELLADARSQIASVDGYIESLRDFWLAQADLDAAMLGRPATATALSSTASSAAEPAGEGH
ncbi:MAG TPA: TolC family protein [Ideonella sp.]|nr:TolC family protein [Ideonella sp.]